jgi:hypothetical protein
MMMVMVVTSGSSNINWSYSGIPVIDIEMDDLFTEGARFEHTTSYIGHKVFTSS